MDASNKSLSDLLTQSLANPNAQVTIGNLQTLIRELLANPTGNVAGTPPSTDRAISIYSGATGLLIQNSLATISAGGTINIPAGQTYNINGVPLGAGAGNVVGSGVSAAGTLPIVNNLTTTAIIPSLVGATAAGSLIIPAGQTITVPLIQALAATDLTIISSSAGKIVMNDSGNVTAANPGLDMSGMGGFIKVKDGAAAGVTIGNSATNGLIFGTNTLSIVTNGVEKWMVNSSGALNPILDNTYDIGNGTVNPRDITVSRDLLTNSIKEKTIGNGVVFGNIAAFTDGTAPNPSIVQSAHPTTGIYFEGDGSVFYVSLLGVDALQISATSVTVKNMTGDIILSPDAGWAASTGTASKAGLDSDDVIYTVGALQNLARTVVAIQNTLMTKGYLTA